MTRPGDTADLSEGPSAGGLSEGPSAGGLSEGPSAGGLSAGGGHDFAVLRRTEPFAGAVFSVVSDEVVMPGGVPARRDYLRTLGAVGVIAIDAEDRVVLIRQYRHAVRRVLWELPAGMLDVAGESALVTAQRELAEEADLVAERWYPLVELHTTPGICDELIRVFLARDLTAVSAGVGYQRHGEEAEIEVHRIDLDQAVAMALRGEITNGPTVAGLLAAAHVRTTGWERLRPAL